MFRLLRDRCPERLAPSTIPRDMNHALHPNILVKPNSPTTLLLGVYPELFSEAFVSLVIYPFPFRTLGFLGSVNYTEFTIPQWTFCYA